MRPVRFLLAAGFAGLLACAPADDAQSLFRDLQSGDSEVRQDAAQRLETVIGRGDWRVFARGAAEGPPLVRAQSLLYLARLTQPEARAALRDFLRLDRRTLLPFNPIRLKPSTEEADSRILVANLIAENGGDPQAVGVLVAGLDDQSAEVLTGTCYALGALRDPQGIPFLAEMTHRPETDLVRAAVQALGSFRTPEAIAALRGVVSHPSAEVRGDLLSSLELQEGAGVEEVLRTIGSSDPVPEIRASAIVQTSRFRNPATVPYLIERLKDRDEAPRLAAQQALKQITGEALGPRAEAWSRWWAKTGSRAAARPL